MIAVLLNVVLKELMSYWIKVITVIVQWYTDLELNWVLKEAWNWMASEYNLQHSPEIHGNI